MSRCTCIRRGNRYIDRQGCSWIADPCVVPPPVPSPPITAVSHIRHVSVKRAWLGNQIWREEKTRKHVHFDDHSSMRYTQEREEDTLPKYFDLKGPRSGHRHKSRPGGPSNVIFDQQKPTGHEIETSISDYSISSKTSSPSNTPSTPIPSESDYVHRGHKQFTHTRTYSSPRCGHSWQSQNVVHTDTKPPVKTVDPCARASQRRNTVSTKSLSYICASVLKPTTLGSFARSLQPIPSTIPSRRTLRWSRHESDHNTRLRGKRHAEGSPKGSDFALPPKTKARWWSRKSSEVLVRSHATKARERPRPRRRQENASKKKCRSRWWRWLGIQW